MLKPKSNWICSYCSKIVKDPIDLPCDESICRQHLSEKDVVKENKKNARNATKNLKSTTKNLDQINL
jgi:hypothetical protein